MPLPPVGTVRWVASRKAAVVAAIGAGAITREGAIERYALSEEELDGWIAAEQAHGMDALRVTRIKAYRDGNGPVDNPRLS
jgi:hypothetical protein